MSATMQDDTTSQTLARQMEKLLREDLAAARQRESTTFDSLVAGRGESVVLFGAGNLGRMALKGLRAVGIEPLAFADNNRRIWSDRVDGLLVYSPEDAATHFGASAVFVVTVWGAGCSDRMSDRGRQLESLGCACVVPFASLFWKYPRQFLPHYTLDLPHNVLGDAALVREAFGLWADDESRTEYVAQLRWRLLLDFDGLPAPSGGKAYFPDDLCRLSADEFFVDCGAFDGDTLKDFLSASGGEFRAVVAFEPDPVNGKRLEKFLSTLPAKTRGQIEVRGAAVGAKAESLRFDVTGTAGSAAGSGTYEVPCCALDEALAGVEATWIKMDIEGFEAGALEGARGLIQRSRPVLAINLEHLQADLWRIPLLMRSLADDYCFFLRPYLLEGWDLVCYAIPTSRCRTHPHHRGGEAA